MRVPHKFTITIHGQDWEIHVVKKDDPRLRDNLGLCELDLFKINVAWDVEDVKFRITFFHEFIHAFHSIIAFLPDKDKDEEVVCEVGGFALAELAMQLDKIPKEVRNRLFKENK